MSGARRGPEKNASRSLTLSAPGLPAAGDLATVAAEGELLDQIGYSLANWSEPYFHLAVRCDVRHTTGQPQRLYEGIVQIDLCYPLLAGLGQWGGAAPHATERVEANGHGRRAWAIGGKELPHHVEQQVDFEVEAHDVRGVRGGLVRLVDRAVLVHGVPGLQDLQVALGEAGGHIAIGRVGHLAPDDG